MRETGHDGPAFVSRFSHFDSPTPISNQAPPFPTLLLHAKPESSMRPKLEEHSPTSPETTEKQVQKRMGTWEGQQVLRTARRRLGAQKIRTQKRTPPNKAFCGTP